MTDEDRLRERLRDQVAAAAIVADLDDVAVRIGTRAHRRERPLVAVAVATLVAGTLGGFAVGRVTRATARSVTVAGAAGSGQEAATTTAAPHDQGGGPAEWSRVFVRTTGDGVTVRVFLDPNASPADVHVEVSIADAVADASQPEASAPTGAIRGLGGGIFGIAEGAPARWAIVNVGPDVAFVGATFGNGSDGMQPVHGIAVLAHLGTGPIVISALDTQGKTVETKSVGDLCVDTCSPTVTTVPPPVPPSLPAPGSEQPSDPAAARQTITQLFADAFEGSKPDPTKAKAIEGGGALTSVFDGLRTGSFARQVTEAKTMIDGIVFRSASSAAVEFHSDLGPDGSSGPYFADATLTPAGWQVTRASYCEIVTAAGAHCP